MAAAVMKVCIRSRWWVKPLVYAAIVPAVLIEVCLGSARCEAFLAAVAGLVAEHGALFESD